MKPRTRHDGLQSGSEADECGARSRAGRAIDTAHRLSGTCVMRKVGKGKPAACRDGRFPTKRSFIVICFVSQRLKAG